MKTLQLLASFLLCTAANNIIASGHLQLGTQYTGKTSPIASWDNLPLGSFVTTTFKGQKKTLGIVTEKNESGCIILFALDIHKSEQRNLAYDECTEIGQTMLWDVPLEDIKVISNLTLGQEVARNFNQFKPDTCNIGDIVSVKTDNGNTTGILKRACDDLYQIQTSTNPNDLIIIDSLQIPFSLLKARKKRRAISPVINSEDDSCYLVNPGVEKQKKRKRLTLAPVTVYNSKK